MLGKRLKDLQKSLAENKIDALLISSPVNIQYLTGYSNFSRDEREAYLFITSNAATLFTDGRYIEAVEKVLPRTIKATIENPLSKINQIVKRLKINKIGFEKNFTFLEYKKFKKEIDAKFILVENLVENLRAVKDVDEIAALKHAAKLTDDCYSNILKNIRMNTTEKELAWRIEKFIKEAGGELAFDTIVAFGPNSAIPHYKTSEKKLTNKDEFILLDFGAKVDNYCSDMTRTLLTKNSSTRAKNIYQTVLAAQKKAIDYLRSGSDPEAKAVAKVANDYIVSKGFDPILHGLGHGIGLEVHEEPHLSPKSKDILVPGNYFSIEPGIYIPGFGGVRIEDDFLLTKKGIETFTHSPKDSNTIDI